MTEKISRTFHIFSVRSTDYQPGAPSSLSLGAVLIIIYKFIINLKNIVKPDRLSLKERKMCFIKYHL